MVQTVLSSVLEPLYCKSNTFTSGVLVPKMQVSRLQLLTSIRSSKGLALLPYLTCDHLCLSQCRYSTSSNDETLATDKNTHRVGNKEIKLPPAPTTCCMSGCHNCVWLVYAEELKKTLCSSSDESIQIILEQITDPNMKAFLKFELSHMGGDDRYRPSCPETPDS